MPSSDESKNELQKFYDNEELVAKVARASQAREQLKRPDGWQNIDDESQVRSVLRKLRDNEALSDNLRSTQERCNELLEEARSERRRRKKLEAALHQILQWDCLNPPRADLLADLPWLRNLIEKTLKDDSE